MQERFYQQQRRWLSLGLTLLLIATGALAETVAFEEKPFAALANADYSPNAQIALNVRPTAWHQGESPHFILHYRRITEAKRVALEIEYHLGYVTHVLGAGPERYAHKSHVFIFEDENDWKAFLTQTTLPQWSSSLAIGDELYLNVRVGQTGMFSSQTLAHETTHAVVARLYPHQRWPLWLSEGFAEQMSGQSVGARMGQYNPRLLQHFQAANLPLDELTAMTVYPPDPVNVARLYQTGERLTRFLMTANPPDRFVRLIDALNGGDSLETAVVNVYGYASYAAFVQRYNAFK